MINNIIKEEFDNIIKNLNCDLKNKKFLITGANGLIGSYLADYLNYNGAQVYAMSRSLEKLKKRFGENSEINFIEQDLNEPIKLNIAFDYIVHTASNCHPLAFSQDPVGTMKTNLLGTINLLEHTKNTGGKFLYISTGEIYGNNTDHAFSEEDLGIVDTKIARSCYPESKRAAETLCVSYSAQYGINSNIARLCFVYGPTITDTNSRADAQFLRNAIDGKDIVMKSEGMQRRTYCYVADAVCALLYILLYGKNTEVYNVANPNSIVSVKEYAETLANIAGINIQYAIPDEIERRGYSKPSDSILDSSKLQNLGWKPKYGIIQGLQNTYKIKKELKGEYNGTNKCTK